MKILLINTNRYRTPPVPPLGLEYLSDALRYTRHRCQILDLCFAEDPVEALKNAIRDFIPDIAGLTIRNIDTVLFENNIFFLDEIKSYASLLKDRGVPVILGGAGYSFIPEGVLRYIGADYGIYGPGEKALPYFLDLYDKNPPPQGTVLNGWEMGIYPDLEINRENGIDHARYVREGGLIGFETQKGCLERCSYCSEGRGRVLYKNPDRIVGELTGMVESGFDTYHLCDTEFNQDLDYCRAFLEAFIRRGLKIRWALYMKSAPFSDDLFRLLERSGANLITLSLPTGEKYLEHTREIRRLTVKYGIRLAVDFLCGFPGETVEMVRNTVETLREIAPDTVGVNSTIRLSPGIAVTKKALSSAEHRERLKGAITDNPDLVRPVFYNHITADMLREIIGDDPLFHIEGFERTSNYERI
ncbi:MAG: cobalamin-dependent protein [Candidatus Latescibacter sp.]|nr:cobalamin-dependent protein [Candidatus Latescibacter sp.]